MKKVAIFGVSGFGREVMPNARKLWLKSGDDFELVFVDDSPQSGYVNGHRVLSFSNWINEPGDSHHINIAIANSKVREEIVERCIKNSVEFYEVRAENIIQLDEVCIGVGAILCPFVTLTSNVKIGTHFHANIYSYVAHDCIVGDYVTLAPGVMCNGNVTIEDHAYIGTGAIIKQGNPGNPLVIGRGAIVGMGAVVTKSVPPYTTVIGNPAKPMIKT